MQGRAVRCWRGCTMGLWCRWGAVAAGWGLLALPGLLALLALLAWLARLGLLGQLALLVRLARLARQVAGLVVAGLRRC